MYSCCLLLSTLCLPVVGKPDPTLLTVAERSSFKATARYDEVVELMDRLADRSPLAHRASMGKSVEGREIPLLIVADPEVKSAAEARAAGKLVLFAFGNIHAGEVCGKEALLMLARDLLLEPERPGHRAVLANCVLLLAPIYNPDGNEDVRQGQRGNQVGPEDGMGRRTNAQGLDLNRDHIKLESPEARAHVALLNQWDPDLVIDTHTTNGSIHRYTLTYAAPQNPSAAPGPWKFVRDEMLPAVDQRLEQRTGYRSFFYGNFDRQKTAWSTYSSQPRFGAPYRGLRNHLAILSEAYAYASYRDRIECTRDFVQECLLYAAEHTARILELRAEARSETVERGRQGGDLVGLRHALAAFDGKVPIESELMLEDASGVRAPSGTLVSYLTRHMGRFEPGLEVTRPRDYFLPQLLASVVDKLRQHGIVVSQLATPLTARFDVYKLTELRRAEREFQGHRQVTLEVTRHTESRRLAAGSYRVSMAQPLGTLALYLLEPESDDGLATWNFLDEWLAVGTDYPILRSANP